MRRREFVLLTPAVLSGGRKAETPWMEKVRVTAETLLRVGLDRYGAKQTPAWAGVIDTRDWSVPEKGVPAALRALALLGSGRMSGQKPAVRPPFWVKRTQCEHEYERSRSYWLPVRHRTRVELRLFGRLTLEIDSGGYRFGEKEQSAGERSAQVALRLAR